VVDAESPTEIKGFMCEAHQNRKSKNQRAGGVTIYKNILSFIIFTPISQIIDDTSLRLKIVGDFISVKVLL